ncbi:hypothetical protein [uncultured Propionivibrio sp.]|uniref:hypothetical protein n=1 Tax=uncultured Propionivibrio sp. TaxID=426737 RepID=UPI0029C0DFB5|nr:hypothetical protein [uncultured Propionivibrio sp.]
MSRTPPKPPSGHAKSPPAPSLPPRASTTNTGAERWQRTVRFNWDKGGSKGGRR